MKEKIKKVGIFTINDDGNFGNRLQNYAVQEILKKYNMQVTTIRKNNLIGRIKSKLKTSIKKVLPQNKYKRQINFNQFNKNIKFKYYKKDKDLNKINNKYDYFLTGSDQVWNPNFGRMSDIDFLTFAPNKKRVSFSASFGIEEIPNKLESFYKERLQNFKAISVREDAGKKIIKNLTQREDIEVLIDPTMLLESGEWDKVLKVPKNQPPKKYILNYFLGNISSERKNEIDRIAKENNCEIINILDINDPYYCSGPSEFLYLEKSAFLICTDSFHSSVFAIIYNRPFIIFEREDKNVNMNSRIETLIRKFNLKDREFKYKITNENLNHDYTEAYQILDDERKKSIEFLKKALNVKERGGKYDK